MFIVALFTVAKMWHQLRCPSVNKENVYITEWNLIQPLKKIIKFYLCSNMDRWNYKTLCQVKDKYYMFSLICGN
jgi:hypothetical protein